MSFEFVFPASAGVILEAGMAKMFNDTTQLMKLSLTRGTVPFKRMMQEISIVDYTKVA